VLLGIACILPFSTTWAAKLHQTYSEQTICLILQLFFLTLAVVLLLTAVYRYFV